MSVLVFTVAYVLLLPVIFIFIFFLIRARVSGKIVAFFVERDKTLKQYLFRPEGKFFRFKRDDEKYSIEADCVMLVKYPFGLPAVIQQIVPCLVYAKGNPQPLSPKDVTVVPKGLTSKMVESTTNENVVSGIARAVEGESTRSRIPSWFLPGLTLLLVAVLALMVFTLRTQMNEILNYVKVISPR